MYQTYTPCDARKSGAKRVLARTDTHTAHLEHRAKRRKRASLARRRRRRRLHRSARRPRAHRQAVQRPCHARSPATTTCHAGTSSSGPAAVGHRWPTTAGRCSRAVPLVRSRSSAAWPRASARASAVIPSTPAAILRTRSTLSPPVCHEREPRTSERHRSTQNATGVARRGSRRRSGGLTHSNNLSSVPRLP